MMSDECNTCQTRRKINLDLRKSIDELKAENDCYKDSISKMESMSAKYWEAKSDLVAREKGLRTLESKLSQSVERERRLRECVKNIPFLPKHVREFLKQITEQGERE